MEGWMNYYHHLYMDKVTGHSKMFHFLPKYKFSGQFIEALLVAVEICFFS